MKKMKLIIYLTVFLALVISCEKMDAYKDVFQKGKEISYPGILDSAKVLPGNGRVMITGLFTSDPKIVKYRIYWNGGLDSLEKGIIRSAGVDTVRQIIGNLPEGNTSFGIRTFDVKGNPSVLVSVSGNIYGNNYQTGIINRGIKSAEFNTAAGLVIDWIEANPTLVATSVAYTAINGSQKIFWTVDNKAHKDTIPDFKPGASIGVRSRYLPEPASIDTFTVLKADTLKILAPFDRTNWIVTGFSDQEATGEGVNNGRAVFAFDGDPATFWHSQWDAAQPVYPHWVSVDMGTSNVISGLLIFPRQGGGGAGTPKDGKIEVSTDGTTWAAAGTFVVGNSNTAYQKIVLKQPTAAVRYVKVTFLTNYSGQPWLGIAELNMF
ncbi:DUF4998 domain-containing protein [Niabella hirudinis]|uniref:DUF4998 domain-containing protein n=1 Tax=Niabella hirudinis TaxID=1285929 RepID=UPI003EB79E17